MQLHTFLQGLSASGCASFQALRWALVIGSAAALVACGSGGGGAGALPDAGDPGAPAAPSGLSLGAPAIKTLNFQWTAVEGATHYKLLEDLDGAGTASAPTEVTASIAGTQFGHEVPLYARLNASYTVKACNALGCSASSAPYALQAADLNAAIGYAKTANGGTTGDNYGFAIALSKDGNTLAVGAPYEDTGATDSGAVYVMRRTAAGVWMTLPMLKDNTPEVDESFGHSLAMSANGQVLAVGVPQGVQDLSGGGTGATGHVQMFTLNANQLGYTAGGTVLATNRAEDDWFGQTVALDNTGNVLAVGVHVVPGDFTAPGAVHVYTRSGDVWGDEQVITASNGEGNDSFGNAVALSGDGKTLAVGAAYEDGGTPGVGIAADAMTDDDSLVQAGAVYVFSRSGIAATDLFADPVYIKASNPGVADGFGFSVALSGDGSVLAVGARSEDSNGMGVGADQGNNAAQAAGAVYVFVRNAGVWSQEAYIKASNTTEQAYFGTAVALSADGDTLAVGARQERRTGVGLMAEPTASPGAQNRGAAYVFKRNAGVWSESAYVKPPFPAASVTNFGYALGLSGDGSSLAVGNPGEDHLASPDQYPIVGAPVVGNGSAGNSGAVYIF